MQEPPFEDISEPTPPVCQLSADKLVVDLIDGSASVDLSMDCLDVNHVGWPYTDWIEDIVVRSLKVTTEESTCEAENAQELLMYGETTLALTHPGTYEKYVYRYKKYQKKQEPS